MILAASPMFINSRKTKGRSISRAIVSLEGQPDLILIPDRQPQRNDRNNQPRLPKRLRRKRPFCYGAGRKGTGEDV